MLEIGRDALWKGIIEDLFEDCLYYFYPEWTEREVDFNKPFEYLDKELDEIYPKSEGNLKFADKLVKVHLKSGDEKWVLVHIEVQGYKDPNFAKRMYTYFYRIQDRYDKDVMALAILTDDDIDYKPYAYYYQAEKTNLIYQYYTFKVLEKTLEELDIPNNPFSIVMLTAHKALKKKQKDSDISSWKIDIVKKLKEANYPSETIRNILNFIRFYVKFAKEENETKFENKLSDIIQNRKNMGIEEAIITEIKKQSLTEGEQLGLQKGEQLGLQKGEQLGLQKGEQLGLQKGLQKAILAMYRKGFSNQEIAETLEVNISFVEQILREQK
jgi:predicted transposase/invertase (TIGR01784 family)